MIYFIGQIPLFNDPSIVNTSLERCINYCKGKQILGLDTETSGLFNFESKIIMLQIGDLENQFVIDTRTIDITPLKSILEDISIVKVLHNASFDYKFLKLNGIILNNVFDTQLAEMVLHTGLKGVEFNLKALLKKYLKIQMDKTERMSFTTQGSTPFSAGQITYGAEDVKDLINLKQSLEKELIIKDLSDCARLENKFVLVLADIEYHGFYLDTDLWVKVATYNSIKLKKQLVQLNSYVIDNNHFEFMESQLDLFESRKCAINWDSSKQVVKYLKFLGVPTLHRDSKTGKNKETCEEKAIGRFRKEFEFLVLYFNYKETAKQLSTYGQTFLSHINPITGRVHSNFWQIQATGRISSNNPNLQNIPAIVDENGEQLFRNCFRGEEDNMLVVADYSQQEPLQKKLTIIIKILGKSFILIDRKHLLMGQFYSDVE